MTVTEFTALVRGSGCNLHKGKSGHVGTSVIVVSTFIYYWHIFTLTWMGKVGSSVCTDISSTIQP